MTEQFSNFAISTLSRSIGETDTIISVAEPGQFPASGTFHIVAQMFDASGQKYKFGDQIFFVGGIPISPAELMKVTAVGGNSFTVQRAQEGTTAYPWPSGTRIAHVMTAAVMQSLQSGAGVASLNGETGALNLVAGSNITITPSGTNITIAASGGGGGQARSINIVSTDTNAAAAASTDYFYLCSGTMTLTLPTAVGNTNLYTIKNVGTGIVTVASAAGTIDGASTMPLTWQYQSGDYISDNTNWNVV